MHQIESLAIYVVIYILDQSDPAGPIDSEIWLTAEVARRQMST